MKGNILFLLSVVAGLLGGIVLGVIIPNPILISVYYAWCFLGFLIFFQGLYMPARLDGSLRQTPLNVIMVCFGFMLSGPCFWIYGIIVMISWFVSAVLGHPFF